MVDLKAITDLATLGLGAYIFLKVWPTVQGVLGGLGGLGGLGQPLMIEGTPPLTAEQTQDIFSSELAKLEAVRAEVARETVPQIAAASVIPGSPIGVGQQAFAVQVQAPGIPLPAEPGLPPIGLPPRPAIDYADPSQFVSVGQASVPIINVRPTGGQFWINPLTQAVLAPYVAGQLPASVSALRSQDIFPAIRGF